MTPDDWHAILTDLSTYIIFANLAAMLMNLAQVLPRIFPRAWALYVMRAKPITLIDETGETYDTWARERGGIWYAFTYPSHRVALNVLYGDGTVKGYRLISPTESVVFDSYVKWWRSA